MGKNTKSKDTQSIEVKTKRKKIGKQLTVKKQKIEQLNFQTDFGSRMSGTDE